MKVVILGSGATAGTLPDCPTLSDFGEALATELPEWREVYTALARAVADSQGGATAADQWNLATVWTRVDYYAKLHRALGTCDYGPEASYDLHRAVLDVYGTTAIERLERLMGLQQSFTLLEIVDTLVAGDVLVSFNWDVVAELIAERRGLPLIQTPHPSSAGLIGLVKPHGSVSWVHHLGKCVEFLLPDGRPQTSPMLSEEVVLNAKEPFLLGAVPIKSELIREVQSVGRTNALEVIQDQWHAFIEGVRCADEIFVVGYSFPQEDQYGRFLLREAVRRRVHGAPPVTVHYYELADRVAEVRKAILETFGQPGIRLQCRGKVEAPNSPSFHLMESYPRSSARPWRFWRLDGNCSWVGASRKGWAGVSKIRTGWPGGTPASPAPRSARFGRFHPWVEAQAGAWRTTCQLT